ncbi:GHMP kinase [Halobacteriales archaeon QH_7_66_37]|nr:MAG: GHMP kinase [Halobacteriales archaeon QH_7_66_37]
MATVETGARLHFGFQNLSLAHERLYGGIGVALAEPRLIVEAGRAGGVRCDDPSVTPYAQRAVEVLDVPGAEVRVPKQFGRHVGLGNGTQVALACLQAIAEAHDRAADVRERAPELERGGRSGVGVATFERGGFVVDAGHPTERFTAEPPDPGDWQVPEPIAAWPLPDHIRFVLVTPAVQAGRSGEEEDDSMRRVVERADPGIGDEIAMLVTRRLLPAVVEGDVDAFGRAVARLGRLNGAWYADEQGGVYRPPAGRLIEALDDSSAVTGAGQSSWGPTVYGVTDAEAVERAVADAETALADLGVDGDVRVVEPRNEGATVDP